MSFESRHCEIFHFHIRAIQSALDFPVKFEVISISIKRTEILLEIVLGYILT